MADANEYEEASLADDFEEVSYDGNDDDSCIVVDDGTEADDGERVIKLCFSSLIRFHRRNPTIITSDVTHREISGVIPG